MEKKSFNVAEWKKEAEDRISEIDGEVEVLRNEVAKVEAGIGQLEHEKDEILKALGRAEPKIAKKRVVVKPTILAILKDWEEDGLPMKDLVELVTRQKPAASAERVEEVVRRMIKAEKAVIDNSGRVFFVPSE